MKLLRSLQLSAPNQLSLALLTATALHHARTLAGSSGTEWSEEIYGAHLDRLLKQLTERSAELTLEQQQELSLLK
jgi:hypothetical protein